MLSSASQENQLLFNRCRIEYDVFSKNLIQYYLFIIRCSISIDIIKVADSVEVDYILIQ